jgi:hypothetical protein
VGSTAEQRIRGGKGTSVAFFEFDTVESAARAREAWRGRVVNGSERLVVRYADTPLAWRSSGGMSGRDHGGENWQYGMLNAAPREEAEARLFREIRKDEQVALHRMMTHYLKDRWRPRNASEIRRMVRKLIMQRSKATQEMKNDHVVSDAEAPSLADLERP